MYKNITTFFLLLILTGCSIHLVPDGPVYREYPDGSSERSTSVSVYTDKPDDTLKRAQHLASKGKYDDAINLYQSVYTDSTNENTYREDALFHKGSLHANFFNENKNYQQALDDLQRLLQEFPETEFRVRAEKKIDEIQQILANR